MLCYCYIYVIHALNYFHLLLFEVLNVVVYMVVLYFQFPVLPKKVKTLVASNKDSKKVSNVKLPFIALAAQFSGVFEEIGQIVIQSQKWILCKQHNILLRQNF